MTTTYRLGRQGLEHGAVMIDDCRFPACGLSKRDQTALGHAIGAVRSLLDARALVGDQSSERCLESGGRERNHLGELVALDRTRGVEMHPQQRGVGLLRVAGFTRA